MTQEDELIGESSVQLTVPPMHMVFGKVEQSGHTNAIYEMRKNNQWCHDTLTPDVFSVKKVPVNQFKVQGPQRKMDKDHEQIVLSYRNILCSRKSMGKMNALIKFLM